MWRWVNALNISHKKNPSAIGKGILVKLDLDYLVITSRLATFIAFVK